MNHEKYKFKKVVYQRLIMYNHHFSGMWFVCIYIIDPCYHYREPNNGLIYGIEVSPRYINDGITRNFNYNAIITGTSMTENFKTSEFDSLFGLESVKIPFSGGSFKEVNNACERALSRNPDIKVILRSLDLSILNTDKDTMRYDSFPDYLYNDNWLDDVNYLLDKNALLKDCGLNVIMATIKKKETFNFDTYANWNERSEFGKEAVLSSHERAVKSESSFGFSEEEKITIRENIEQNVIELAKEYPNTRFILFFTPYSICAWDTYSQDGVLFKNIEIQEEVIELLLPYENIELYSFCDNFGLVCDLDNYMDRLHYSKAVNSDILRWIAEGKYRIIEDNYQGYLEKITEFYSNYDYDSIYE